jgi:hypothetical protein
MIGIYDFAVGLSSQLYGLTMRCQTNTINYGKELPLAQGIEFDV